MVASEGSSHAGGGDGRGRRRDAVLLGIGSAANGLIAYLFFAVAGRHLGALGVAPVSVLWSYWAVSAAVVTFPVQQWVVRRFHRDGHEANVALTMPRLVAVVVLLAALAGAVSLVFRVELFGEGSVGFPAMVSAITVGAFFMGVVRGVLSGRGRYGATALSLVAENLLRLVAAAIVAWLGFGATAMGVAMLFGSAAGLAWASQLRLRVPPEGVAARRDHLGLVLGVAGGSLVAQVVLTGPPVVLALAGGAPPAVTSVFLALAVWRAPYLLAMGVTPQVTARLTHLTQAGPVPVVVRVVRLTVLVTLAGAVVAAVVGGPVLEVVVRFAFGVPVALTELQVGGLGAGTAFAIGNLMLMLLLLAHGRSGPTSLAWAVALLAGAAAMALLAASPTARVVAAFLTSEATAFAALTLAAWRAAGRGDLTARSTVR